MNAPGSFMCTCRAQYTDSGAQYQDIHNFAEQKDVMVRGSPPTNHFLTEKRTKETSL